MAIKKTVHAGKATGAESASEVERTVRERFERSRTPLRTAAVVAGGVVALGAAFGVGLIAGHATPGFPGGDDFAAGRGPEGGHGLDRDGDHGRGSRPGDGGGERGFGGHQGQDPQGPDSNGMAPNGTAPAPNAPAPAPGGSTTTTP